jgi:TAT-translocated FGD2 family F420-dependent dehydrogenase
MPRSSVRGPKLYYVLASEEFDVSELVRFGVEAELAGFDGVWTSDHFQPWQANEGHSAPAWITLAALTQRTSRITMGTGVTCPSFRYRPAVVAQAWAGLSILAPGRIFLGLGTGEKLNEGAAGGGWGSYAERSARLVEAVEIIRSLWRGKQTSKKRRFWDVDAKLYDPPASHIPIYIAAGGPRSARLAGLHGDGLITSAKSLKSEPQIKRAWDAAGGGRGHPTRPIVVEHFAVVGGEEEARQGAERWRFMPKAWEPGYHDNVSPTAIQARATREIPIDKVMDGWTVSREPAVHAKAIKELSALGATHIVVHVPSPNQSEAIDFFGRKVIRSLKKS